MQSRIGDPRERSTRAIEQGKKDEHPLDDRMQPQCPMCECTMVANGGAQSAQPSQCASCEKERPARQWGDNYPYGCSHMDEHYPHEGHVLSCRGSPPRPYPWGNLRSR